MPGDRKQYSKTRPIALAEFDLEKAWWHNRQETEHAWKVSVEEIRTRGYNLDIKNPHTTDLDHGDPQHLLNAYQKRLDTIAAQRLALKEELSAALQRAGHVA